MLMEGSWLPVPYQGRGRMGGRPTIRLSLSYRMSASLREPIGFSLDQIRKGSKLARCARFASPAPAGLPPVPVVSG